MPHHEFNTSQLVSTSQSFSTIEYSPRAKKTNTLRALRGAQPTDADENAPARAKTFFNNLIAVSVRNQKCQFPWMVWRLPLRKPRNLFTPFVSEWKLNRGDVFGFFSSILSAICHALRSIRFIKNLRLLWHETRLAVQASVAYISKRYVTIG